MMHSFYSQVAYAYYESSRVLASICIILSIRTSYSRVVLLASTLARVVSTYA